MGKHGQIVKRVGQEHRQALEKLIRDAARSHSTWQLWDDLIYFAAAALSQPLKWVQDREDEYLRRIGRYDKKIQNLFPQMFAEIILAFNQEGCVDILGDMYMQLELYNKWHGQFFTPSHVCEMMSHIVGGTQSELADEVERYGYISVEDPCCGGGAMLISYAKYAQEMGLNYQKDVLFVGQDVDPVVARMCYVSMSLLGMPGYVVIGNSLLMDTQNFDYWFTPMYFVSGFSWRRQKQYKNSDATAVTQEAETSEGVVAPTHNETLLQRPEMPSPLPIKYDENNAGQLSFF